MFIRDNVSSLDYIDGLIFIIKRLINHLELISNLNLVSTSLSNLLIHELSDFLILNLEFVLSYSLLSQSFSLFFLNNFESLEKLLSFLFSLPLKSLSIDLFLFNSSLLSEHVLFFNSLSLHFKSISLHPSTLNLSKSLGFFELSELQKS